MALALIEAESAKKFMRQFPIPSIDRPMHFGEVPVGKYFRIRRLVFQKIDKRTEFGNGVAVIKYVDIDPNSRLKGQELDFDDESGVYPVTYREPQQEAESAKSFLQQLSSPAEAFVERLGFRHDHHDFWVKRTSRGPAELYGLCWIQLMTDPDNRFRMHWLKVIYHLVRPDKTPWHTYRAVKPDVPGYREDQLKVRDMLRNLVWSCDAAVRNAPRREPNLAIDSDPARRQVGNATAAAFRSFEIEWDEMMNQPL